MENTTTQKSVKVAVKQGYWQGVENYLEGWGADETTLPEIYKTGVVASVVANLIANGVDPHKFDDFEDGDEVMLNEHGEIVAEDEFGEFVTENEYCDLYIIHEITD